MLSEITDTLLWLTLLGAIALIYVFLKTYFFEVK